MKIFKILCLVVFSLFVAMPVMAEFYASAGMGVVKNTGNVYKDLSKEDYRTSAAYSVAFGYKLPVMDALRVEAEFLHNRAKISHGKGNVDLNALMANGYVNFFSLLPVITPYVGAGIGYGRLESTHVMPMQVILGVDGDIFALPSLIASAEYRFLQTNTEAKRANEKDKYYAHILMLKLRYEF